MSCVLTAEEWTAGLDEVVAELLSAAGVTGPPVDAALVASALGLTVAWDEAQSGRARYVRVGGAGARRPRAMILLRRDPRREREQWALAHELGEHAAARVFHRWGLDPCEVGPALREQVANRLAARLLAPTPWLLDDARQLDWHLAALKARYATASHELLARRMLECPPAVIVTIFDHGRMTFRRGNRPGRAPSPMVDEWRCWRQVHANSAPCRLQADCQGLARVDGWPVHEPEWKREILRAELAEDSFDG